MAKELKNYKVNITETYSRNVVIRAENEFQAADIAEELCNIDLIDVATAGDFGSRGVGVLGIADETDMKELSRYGK